MTQPPGPDGNTGPGNGLTDGRGRVVNYLRLSVTDRCNLACRYCAARSGPDIPHQNILRYEELLKLIGLARDMGLNKVRLTGGEPFVRRDFADFVVMALKRFPGLDLRLTTNGTLLEPHLAQLAAAGLTRVNISLDTLIPAKFEAITGRALFRETRRSVDACLDAGMGVKLNVVAIKGFNDNELPAFLALARTTPLDVRFIEYMPVGCGSRWSKDRLWPATDILARARDMAELTEQAQDQADAGPARMYAIEGGAGRLGFISALSDHFCDRCNRLRITADGRLRPCLFSDKSYRLRPALRNPHLGLDAVRRILETAGRIKPLGHDLLEAQLKNGAAVCDDRMRSIGG